jgi:hypothetical protein
MSNPNKNQKQLVPSSSKEAPSSPSEVTATTSCASSVHTTMTTLDDQRLHLQSQTMQLGVASVATLTAVTLTFVPIQLLVGLGLFLAMFVGVLYTLYQRALLEYQTVVTGRGLGDYLPERWYDQLANESFHDWMVNGTFVQDNQHFALYFIPGLTNDQLEAYVDRLLPRHQRELRRPGLGNLFGPQFMRLLVGDSRLQHPEHQMQRSIVPRRLELEHHTTPTTENHHHHSTTTTTITHSTPGGDDASRLGDDDDPASQYVRSWGMEPENTAATTTSVDNHHTAPVSAARAMEVDASASVGPDDDDDDDEEEEDLAINASVVVDALLGGIDAYYNMTYDMVRGYTLGTVTWLTRGFLRTSLTVGVASVGLGALGIWTGVYEPPRSFSMPRMNMNINIPRVSLPSQSVLLSSTLASTATAGMMLLLFGFPDTSSNNHHDDDDDDDAGKKKKRK